MSLLASRNQYPLPFLRLPSGSFAIDVRGNARGTGRFLVALDLSRHQHAYTDLAYMLTDLLS